MANNRINHLSEVELSSSSALIAYVKIGRDLARDLGYELDMSGAELEARLQSLGGGHNLALGMDTRWRARQVAAHFYRASDAAQLFGIELIKARESFRRHFNPEAPKPEHKPFDIES